MDFDESDLFNELVREVPDGMWVAISQSEDKLVSQGYTIGDVKDKAKEAGELNPRLYRVRHFQERKTRTVH